MDQLGFGWIKSVTGPDKTFFPERGAGGACLRLRGGRLQCGALAEGEGGDRLITKVSTFAGRWPVVEMDVRDNDLISWKRRISHCG
jgi:hypothetical protein